MATQVKSEQIVSKNQSRGSEIVAIVLIALAVLVFLCLVTYNANDWNFNTASSQKTQNWVGVFGAVVSDLLFQFVGLIAYSIPLLLALIAWRVYQTKNLFPSVSRILGHMFFVASAASLLSLFSLYGGIVGAFFAQNFAWLLGTIGATIVLSAVCIASFLLISNLSFNAFSGHFDLAFENLQIRIDEWRQKRREARKQNTFEKKEKREKNIVEKHAQMPTISNGEAITVSSKEKTVREKKPGVLDKFVAPEAPEQEKPETFEEPEIQPEEEEIVPTISASEKPQTNETAFTDLIAESEKIPITPMQQTGELDAEVLDEIEAEEEPQPPAAPKPQSFENYVLPSTEFLTAPPPHLEQKDEELLAIAKELTEKTKEFNVTGRVMHICQGPVVTTYEFKPDPGVKYSRVTNLVDDLCLALKAESIRIDRIPGKAFVGIEVPNRQRETIFLRDVIESKKFEDSKSLLTIALGKKIDGLNYVTDLAKMPHLLIAGATGAGKSVGVNTLVVSILYKAKPDEVKFIMVDPKRLELGLYADIPHLATPIITDPKRAAISLKWAVSEMERRYRDLAGWGVRNIDGYNAEVKKRTANEQFDDNGEPFRTLPYIVIIIDELADLMMVSSKEVEESITRLAQMARAVGIHLVLATQRPSVDVITGLIKANFPARISFRVSSKVDSRTIIDSNGAESLLGKGDMLFLPPATSQIVRVHGAFVDEKEIHRIVEHIKSQGKPEYDTTITKTEDELDDSGELPGKKDELFWEAVKTVVMAKKASTSLLQRHLRIGYGRAAAILDAMVREGYIGDMDGSSRARPILQKAYDDLQDIEEQNQYS